MKGLLIAIAGMMGSGKTTLARNISSNLGWTLLPENLRSRLYLNDLFFDESRWAFDTQISFLCEKAIRLNKYLLTGKNVILDRSLYEDIEIFAGFFYSQKKIDERSFDTYKELAKYFLSELPTPNLVIYCDCPLTEIENRIYKRQRNLDLKYPKDHVELVFKRYVDWLNDFTESPFYLINSQKYDFRNNQVINRIGNEIRSILTQSSTIYKQLLLPGLNDKEYSFKEPEILKQIVPVKTKIGYDSFKEEKNFSSGYPTVYIAAPFTSKASSIEKKKSMNLFFDVDEPHGIIEKSPYRSMLNGISNSFKRKGFNVILPHRDINEWGHKTLSSQEVFKLCTNAVESSDLFVGILGTSHGSHYEFGIAIGLNRPSIIIMPKEMEHSFIAQGITSSPDKVLLIECDNIANIPSLMNQSNVKKFLRNFFPMEDLK